MHPTSTASGYSPDIEIILEVAGLRLNVAALGPGFLVLHRPAHLSESAEGVVSIVLDGKPLSHRILLAEGLDPNRERQPFSMISCAAREEPLSRAI